MKTKKIKVKNLYKIKIYTNRTLATSEILKSTLVANVVVNVAVDVATV